MAVLPSTDLIPVAVAQEMLLGMLGATTAEVLVPLGEARGRVLARTVVSGRLLPGCDNSAMDGYAVSAADCAGASAGSPVRLAVNGEARAGAAVGSLVPGTAMAISTGAPVPQGADAIIPVEEVAGSADAAISVMSAPPVGRYIRTAGEDVVPGTVMLPRGRRLRAADIAACAAVGAAQVWVSRPPRVAILSGGDELVPVGAPAAPHQVADSNGAMLAAAIAEAGGEVVELGIAADSREAVRERLGAVAGCDLLVTSAGVSVGRHDHVTEVVAEMGTIEGWRLAMRPGKPLLIGRIGAVPMLGLPGNPVSAAVTFELFGRPAVLALQGAAQVHRRRIAMRLGEDVVTPEPLETYLRVRLADAADGIPVATLSGGQGSSMLRSLTDADGLAIVPVGVSRADAGSVLTGLELS